MCLSPALEGRVSLRAGGRSAAVCSAPQLQLSLLARPQPSMFAPNLPTPVLGLISRCVCVCVCVRVCACERAFVRVYMRAYVRK